MPQGVTTHRNFDIMLTMAVIDRAKLDEKRRKRS